jgi:hypothetical protein
LATRSLDESEDEVGFVAKNGGDWALVETDETFSVADEGEASGNVADAGDDAESVGAGAGSEVEMGVDVAAVPNLASSASRRVTA